MVRSERRSSSASEMPKRSASRFAAAYSASLKLICVRIMITSYHDLLSQTNDVAHPRFPMRPDRHPRKVRLSADRLGCAPSLSNCDALHRIAFATEALTARGQIQAPHP